MMAVRKLRRRILAIDPTHRGFGFVVLEEPLALIDWGLRYVPTLNEKEHVRRVVDLLRLVVPDVVVVEDVRHPSCRRGTRVRRLIEAIEQAGRREHMSVRRVARADVRRWYAKIGSSNKDSVAAVIVDQFPELESILPPKRKTWMPEDQRMAVFDAATLAFYCIE